jgi:putative transposase
LGRAHADYARYVNVVRRGCGHVWQSRFYSCAMDVGHTWQALCYVEQNPVRAGLVGHAPQYQYSSARAHVATTYPKDIDHQSRLSVSPEWAAMYSPGRWREVLQTSIADECLAERLREATRRGLPFGSDEFRRKLEAEAGRDLSLRPPGRPRRTAEHTTHVG